MGKLTSLLSRLKNLRDSRDSLDKHYRQMGLPQGRNYQKQSSNYEMAINKTQGDIKNLIFMKITVVKFKVDKNSNQEYQLELPLNESDSREFIEFFFPHHFLISLTQTSTGSLIPLFKKG